MAFWRNKLQGNASQKARFDPSAEIPASTVQEAIQYIYDNAAAVGTVYADKSAQYITAAAEPGLDSERVATGTDTIAWDFGTSGQAKASLSHLGIEDLTDPGADRLAFWDDSTGAFGWGAAGFGLEMQNTNLHITDANLVANAATTLGAASADQITYFTSPTASSYAALTAYARSLLDDADAATARATLGLNTLGGIDDVDEASIGDGDVLVWDAAASTWIAENLTAAAGAPNDATYFVASASGTLTAETVVPAFAQTLIDDTTQGEAQTTLGLVPGTDVQAHSAILDNTTASFQTADETKLDYISITQAVDLDAIETRINALDAAVVLQGTWDASAGTFPGGGSAFAGDSYIVSVTGTVDGIDFVEGDRIIAILDNASTTTYAANWHKADYTDQVSSVAGYTGAVTLASGDLTDVTAFAETLLDDADAATARTTLGVGTGDSPTFESLTLSKTITPALTLVEPGSPSNTLIMKNYGYSASLDYSNSSGTTIVDLSAIPLDGSSDSTVRFHRYTTTTGAKYVDFLLGDGSATVDSRIRSGDTSYFNVSGGNVGFGTSSPSEKVHVSGNVLATDLFDGGDDPAADAQLANKQYVDGIVPAAIGSTVQAYDADLTAIGALTKTDGNIIVGNGSTWVAESGATARASLGVYSTAETDAAIASGGVGIVPVATRTALKALDTTTTTTALLTEAGRQGVFVYRAGNYSGNVTADTEEGVYIKADAIATTVGAWVRIVDAQYNVNWFGADNTGTTDSAAAINAAIDLAVYAEIGEVHVHSGTYRCDTPIIPKSQILLRGDGERTILQQYDSYLFQPIEDWLNGEISYFRCEMEKTGPSGAWDVCLKLRSHKFCNIHNLTFWGYGNNTIQERFPTSESTENCTYNKYRDWYFDECTNIDLAGGYEDFSVEHKSGKIELVENGLFQANTSGWTNGTPSYVSMTNVANKMRVTSTSATVTNKYVYQAVAVTPGVEYSYQFDSGVASGAAGSYYRIGTAPDLFTYANHNGASSTATGSFVPTAGVTTVYISLLVLDNAPANDYMEMVSVSIWQSNLVQAGDFSVDPTTHGWTVSSANTTLTVNGSGQGVLATAGAAAQGVAYQEIEVEVGRRYRFTADFIAESTANGQNLALGNSVGAATYGQIFYVGSLDTAFVPTQTPIYLWAICTYPSQSVTLDNIRIEPRDDIIYAADHYTKTWAEQNTGSVMVFKENKFRKLTNLTPGTQYTVAWASSMPIVTLTAELDADEKAIIRAGAPISAGRKPISNTEFNNIKGNGVYGSGYQSRWWEDATDYTRCRVKLSRDNARGWVLNPGDRRGTQGGDHATWLGPTMTHETWVDVTTIAGLDFGPGSFAITGSGLIADSGWEDSGTIYTLDTRGNWTGDFELTGTVAVSGTTMTGSGTKFLTELTKIGAVADKLHYRGTTVGISTINSDTSVTLAASTLGTISAGAKIDRRNSSDKRSHYLQFGAYGSSHGDIDSPQQGVIIREGAEYDIVDDTTVSAMPATLPAFTNAQIVAARSPANQFNKYYGKLVINTNDDKIYVALGSADTDNWLQVTDGTTTKTPT